MPIVAVVVPIIAVLVHPIAVLVPIIAVLVPISAVLVPIIAVFVPIIALLVLPGRAMKGEGKIDQWIKGKEAVYLNTPMGQRPGEFVWRMFQTVQTSTCSTGEYSKQCKDRLF